MNVTGRIAVAVLALILVGCSGGSASPASLSSTASATPSDPAASATPSGSAASATPSGSAASAAASAVASSARPTVTAEHLTVGALTRYYLVAVPPDVAGRDLLPLLLALHGAELTMRDTRSITGFDMMALDPGAIVVYPQGEKDPDNPHRAGYIWNSGQTDTGFDDVGFLAALIDRMEADYPVDPNRTFILGGSNGGQMAYRFACEHPERVAAVADVVGALLVDCQPSQPVSVIDIHGTADPWIPVDGGGFGCQPMECPPLADTMDRWRQLDGCSGDPTVTADTHTSETTWTDCNGGTAVTFIKAKGKGHEWYTSDPDDRAVTWDFFMDHPRSAGTS